MKKLVPISTLNAPKNIRWGNQRKFRTMISINHSPLPDRKGIPKTHVGKIIIVVMPLSNGKYCRTIVIHPETLVETMD